MLESLRADDERLAARVEECRATLEREGRDTSTEGFDLFRAIWSRAADLDMLGVVQSFSFEPDAIRYRLVW